MDLHELDLLLEHGHIFLLALCLANKSHLESFIKNNSEVTSLKGGRYIYGRMERQCMGYNNGAYLIIIPQYLLQEKCGGES